MPRSSAVPSRKALSTSSPITKLPNELLSAALSELDLQNAKTARFVCRGFYDCAWPAFGAGLASYTFDLRNQRSWDNFNAVSKKKELAPYVRSLHFGCGCAYQDFLYALRVDEYSDDDKSSDDRLRLEKFVRGKSFWVPPEYHTEPGEQVAYASIWDVEGPTNRGVADTQLAIETLTSTLSRFTNLNEVRYLDYLIPSAYEETVETVIYPPWRYDQNTRERFRDRKLFLDHAAMDILLQSLASNRVTVRKLGIPALERMQFSFLSPTNRTVMRTVLSKLTKLNILFLQYSGDSSPIVPGRTICLATEQGQRLTDLELDYFDTDEAITNINPLSSLPAYPCLKWLKLFCIDPRRNGVLEGFLAKIRGSLEVLELRYALDDDEWVRESWPCMLVKWLQREGFYLKRLELSARGSRIMGEDIPRQALEDVAQKVVLCPDHLERLRVRWALDDANKVAQ